MTNQFLRYRDGESNAGVQLNWSSPGYEQQWVHDYISHDPYFTHQNKGSLWTFTGQVTSCWF